MGADVLNTIALIAPYEEMSELHQDPAETLEVWRKWTRLTHLAITGSLLDSDGSMVEKDDLRLIHEVSWIADRWARVHENTLEAPRTPRRRTPKPAVDLREHLQKRVDRRRRPAVRRSAR